MIGSGYIGVECSSFLHKLGFETTLLARTTLLRGFDSGVAMRLKNSLVNQFGLDLREGFLPNKIEKNENGRFEVEIKLTKDNQVVGREEFDTILMAISRHPVTQNLNLERLGVETNKRNKKVIGGHKNEVELTSIDSIYAVGDVLEGAPELTPTAVMSGVHVANKISQKLKNKFPKKIKNLDFTNHPTTVFSYPEYSMCGLSEEDAIAKHGEENIEIWHSITTPLEEELNTDKFSDGSDKKIKSYFKLVCLNDTD